MNDVSGARFEAEYAIRKERLRDLTTNNRLLNLRETRFSTIQISFTDLLSLLDAIVLSEWSLKSPRRCGRTLLGETEVEIPATEYRVTPGDLVAKKTPPDLERSLYGFTSLRRSWVRRRAWRDR